MMKIFSMLLMTLLLQSCAGMVDQMYRDFDRADGRAAAAPPVQGNFDMYRGNPNFKSNRRPPTSAMTNPAQATSSERPRMMPSVQRQYESQANGRRRVKADDLRDNGGNGSLWSSDDGKTNHLFSAGREVQNGDIVLINVYNKLKNEITLELKRAYPESLAAKKDDKKDNPNQPAEQTDQVNNVQAAPANAGDGNFDQGVTGTNRVYDRISSVVIEEIDDQHILLRGRKDVLYKNRKRLIEIQALVPKRDLNDNNTVNSDNILEQTITVLR